MPQTGYVQPYASQPLMGTPYPGMNTIWYTSFTQKTLKPTRKCLIINLLNHLDNFVTPKYNNLFKLHFKLPQGHLCQVVSKLVQVLLVLLSNLLCKHLFSNQVHPSQDFPKFLLPQPFKIQCQLLHRPSLKLLPFKSDVQSKQFLKHFWDNLP